MESINIVDSMIAAVKTISLSYTELRKNEKLPRAFIEMEDYVSLVAETLHHLQQGLQIHFLDWEDDDVVVKFLFDGLTKCFELVRSIESILRAVVKDSGFSSRPTTIDSYLQMVESVGKGHSIEILTLNLLNELRLLFLNDSITENPAFPRQDEKLGNACKSLTAALLSLPTSASYEPFTTSSIVPKASATTSVFSKASTASSAFPRYSVTRSAEKTSKGGEYTSERKSQQLAKSDLAKDNSDEWLSVAARSGAEHVFRDLIEMDHIDLNRKGTDGRTPLSFAAEKGYTTVTRLLLELDSDTESTDTAGRTPLSLAAGEGHHAVVEVLLDHGGDRESTDIKGRTPLSWAAGVGHIAVVRLLLECSSNIESRDNNGWTPLFWAAKKEHKGIVTHLLQAGANVDSLDNDGRTLLSWAAEQGQEAAVIQLLDAGADPNSKDSTGSTPLSRAAEKGHLGVVQRLLLVEDLKVSGVVSEEAGWLASYEDASPTTADTRTLLSKLDVNLHQTVCAHKLRQTETAHSTCQSSDLCRVDMQNQLSLLCGLAGVFPPGSNQSSAFGWASFSIQEASIFFSDKPDGDSTAPRAADELILQLHRAVSGLIFGAICLQQSGFCCNQFTVLTVSQCEPGHSVIGMNTVSFDCLLKLEESITMLRCEGLSDFTMSQCVSTSVHILERLFDVTLPLPSTIDLKFHYCSLAMQLLCLGLVLYSRAHVGTFHPAYLASPIEQIILRGSSPDQIHIIVEQRELACMGEMVGDKVFVFRIISKSVQAEAQETLGHLEATCEEIVDSWGPGSLLFASPDELSEEKILGLVIRGGVVELHGKLSNGDGLYHWGDQLVRSDPFLAETFGYRDRIIVGAVLNTDRELAANLVCDGNPEIQGKTQSSDNQKPSKPIGESARCPPEKYGSTTVNVDCKRDHSKTWKASQKYRSILGTEPSAWKLVERNVLFQGGYQLILQAGAAQTKQPGVPGKRAVLDRWINEKKLSLFEELHGLQVSICTGVARRVPLRVLVRDDLMEYLGSLPVPKWKTLKHQASAAMTSKSRFEDWYTSLDDESMTCVKEVFHTILHRLKDTGFDKNGVRFAIAWPNDSEARHCINITPEGNQEWCRMFEDTEWSTTFAVATKLCLNAPSHKCNEIRGVWGGMKMLSTFMSESLSDKAPSADDARAWRIEHNKWYWGGKVGGEVLFLARKSPKEVAELEFHRCRLHLLPRRFWSIVPPRDVVKEIADVGDEGENVFVLPRL